MKRRDIEPIDRQRLLELLAAELPLVATLISQCESEGFHLEAAAFREATEDEIDSGHFWMAEKHFRFVEKVLARATPEIENALSIYYLEDLALGTCTPDRHRAVHERMPKMLLAEMIRIHPRWR